MAKGEMGTKGYTALPRDHESIFYLTMEQVMYTSVMLLIHKITLSKVYRKADEFPIFILLGRSLWETC